MVKRFSAGNDLLSLGGKDFGVPGAHSNGNTCQFEDQLNE